MAVVGGCSTKKKMTRFDLWHGEEKGKKKKRKQAHFQIPPIFVRVGLYP
jgi:hypothetical protein